MKGRPLGKRILRVLAFLWLLALSVVAWADVYVLTTGDRVSGKTVLRGNRSFAVQTPYGRLTIPRGKVERILHDDGKEELLNPTPQPAATPPPPPVQLLLVITGKTFWYAWDRHDVVADPALRFEIRLDEETIASYLDSRTDPDDLPGALVNSFSFAPGDVQANPAPGVQLPPAEARPGRILLRIELPIERGGYHRLRVVYQFNEATAADPVWRDVVETSLGLELKSDTPSFVQIRQDPGQMEFSGFNRRRMKRVDTFALDARAE